MIEPVFVDTNVIVHRYDTRVPEKQSRADEWLTFVWSSHSGRVSTQVLSEFYSTITRKLKPAMAAGEVRRVVRGLSSWQPVSVDLPVLERAWFLQDRFSLSWWDALIVAAAQMCECEVLLTEDLQHGRVLDTVRVIDPFASPERTPEEVLTHSGTSAPD